MKAFIFDPLWDDLITPSLLENLKAARIDIHVIKEIAPLVDCKELFEGEEERILCLNPDYVGWKFSGNDYKAIPHLRAIVNAATSFSWIDTGYATEQNIPVCNIRGFSKQAVAEWAIMMMLNLARKVPLLIKEGFPLDYDKDYMTNRGIELRGKTAGIIGLGNIGQAIAERCKGLGMNVIYWSKNTRSDKYELLDVAKIMSTADVIFPAVATNDESKALFSTELLDTIKPTALFVDVAHELYEHQLLIQKVANGELFGYGFESSKPGDFSNYSGNIWAAPEYAWVTDSSMYTAEAYWVKEMINASRNEFPNRIN